MFCRLIVCLYSFRTQTFFLSGGTGYIDFNLNITTPTVLCRYLFLLVLGFGFFWFVGLIGVLFVCLFLSVVFCLFFIQLTHLSFCVSSHDLVITKKGVALNKAGHEKTSVSHILSCCRSSELTS